MRGCRMARRCLGLLVAILLAVPVTAPGGETDNASSALGFVCRVVTAGNVAVVTTLSGAFVPQSRIRFYDDKGEQCATGVVRNTHTDLAYIALDSGSVECLKKGFVAYSGEQEEKAKAICRFSLNIPMFIEKAGRGSHTIPANVIVISAGDNGAGAIYFRHYVHDMECRKCHHHEIRKSCRECHPAEQGVVPLNYRECLRDRCMGCHKGREASSEECVWCHR